MQNFVPEKLKQTKLWAFAFGFWVVGSLSSMAGMSISGSVMIAAALFFSWRASLGAEWREFLATRAFQASVFLFAVSVASVAAAWLSPPLGQTTSLGRELFKFHYLLYPFAVALSLLCTRRSAVERLEEHFIWKLIFWAGLVLFVVSALQFFGGYLFPEEWLTSRFFRRAPFTPFYHGQGIMMFHLSFASVMSFLVSYGAARFLWEKKWPWLLFAVATSCALFFSYSRIAFVTLPAIWVFVFFLKKPRWGLVAAAVALSIAILSFQMSPSLRGRFADLQGLKERSQVWAGAIAMVKDRPLLGVGFGKSGHYNQAYAEIALGAKPFFSSHSHNNILDAAAATGIFGVVAYFFWWLAFLYWPVKIWWRTRKETTAWLAPALIAAAIAFQINGLTQVNFYDAKSQHSLMLWAGLCLALELYEKRKRV